MKHCANDACSDLVRDGVRGEYQDRLATCPTCGERLSEGPATPAPSERTEWVEQVCIATYADLTTGHVARMRLESAGIPAVVQDQSMHAIYPQAIAARLFVPPERAEEAERILASDDAELVDEVAVDEEAPSAAAVEEPPPQVVSPYLATETWAIFLIAGAYPLVQTFVYAGAATLTARELVLYSVWDLGWVVLLCALLTRDPGFRWNLPATRARWSVEAAWGIALYFVSAGAGQLFRDLATSFELQSVPTPWQEWLEDPDVLLAFRFTAPLAALHEELLFRVYLQTRFTRIARGWSIVVVPAIALLFALYHDYAPVETAGVFGSALVLGISYQVSRSVPRVVIAHLISSLVRES